MTDLPKPSPPRSARLFAEPEKSSPPRDAFVANVDGAARGNPGPAAYGVVIRGSDGKPLAELSKYIGRATNNVAEYYGLITALDYAASHGISKLHVRTDSELMARQMRGLYKVKSPELRPLYERAAKLARALESFSIEHVPREVNARADRLANEALDRTGSSAASYSQPANATSEPDVEPAKRIVRVTRARYRKGVLVPESPLDLEEGQEVEITLRVNGGS